MTPADSLFRSRLGQEGALPPSSGLAARPAPEICHPNFERHPFGPVRVLNERNDRATAISFGNELELDPVRGGISRQKTLPFSKSDLVFHNVLGRAFGPVCVCMAPQGPEHILRVKSLLGSFGDK